MTGWELHGGTGYDGPELTPSKKGRQERPHLPDELGPRIFDRGRWKAADLRHWHRGRPTLRDPGAQGWPKRGRRTKDEDEARVWAWAYVPGEYDRYRAERARYEVRKANVGASPSTMSSVEETAAGDVPDIPENGQDPADDRSTTEAAARAEGLRGSSPANAEASIDDFLTDVGFMTLGEDPTPGALEAVLRRFAASLNGVEPPRNTTIREAAVSRLKRAGILRIMPHSKLPFVMHWRRLVASTLGPASSTTRLILLTLSTYMDGNGDNCWPSRHGIKNAAGCSLGAVKNHIKVAEDSDWIRRHQRPRADGRGLDSSIYRPVLPDYLATALGYSGGVGQEVAGVGQEVAGVGQEDGRGGPGGRPGVSAGSESGRESEKQLFDGVTAVTPNASENGKKPEQGTDDDPDFQRFKAAYPKRAGGQRWKQAGGHWRARLKEGWTPEALVDAAARYRKYIEGTGRTHSEFVKQAATFLNDQECLESDWELPEAPRRFSREAARPQKPEDYGEATTEMPAWR